MRVDSIKNGIVIDHITAGKAMEIYNMLELNKLSCPVALLMNVPSRIMGEKDIIKIDSADIDFDFNVLAYVSPGITVNIIRDEKLLEKKELELPAILTDVIKCKNPRCITTTEQEIHHIFRLTDAKKAVYRCAYCDVKYGKA